MKYMARLYQPEEEMLRDLNLDPDTSCITSVEFNAHERTITYTIRTTNPTEHFTEVSEGFPRRVKYKK